jgi:hypothetical protein
MRGWGELHIQCAEPYAGKEWTDSGRNRDQRPPSSAPAGRSVWCPARPLRHAAVSTWLNGGVPAGPRELTHVE